MSRSLAGPIIPIVYNLNLRDPSGYFLAQNFEMRNKDVIYTSNAASVETTSSCSSCEPSWQRRVIRLSTPQMPIIEKRQSSSLSLDAAWPPLLWCNGWHGTASFAVPTKGVGRNPCDTNRRAMARGDGKIRQLELDLSTVPTVERLRFMGECRRCSYRTHGRERILPDRQHHGSRPCLGSRSGGSQIEQGRQRLER